MLTPGVPGPFITPVSWRRPKVLWPETTPQSDPKKGDPVQFFFTEVAGGRWFAVGFGVGVV